MKSSNEILQEVDRIVIVFVEGNPGRRDVDFAQPAAYQSGLAIPGRRGDQREWAFQASAKTLNEARARHEILTNLREKEFGCEQG